MIDDQFKLRDKSDTELHAWLADKKPGSEEYNAGIKETMNRIAIIEELIEKKEAPIRKRELIAIGIAIVSLAIAITAIVNM